uniref:protein tyrosine phosphatase domain-containing protein 1 n=1 Tax=Pristiophorus japonicus TaxID=55135 RepID=UPI00398F2734
MNLQIPIPVPSYSQARENLIKAVSPHLICSLMCGGKECRYEGPDGWTLQQQAIRGLFSAWVTDDILAMARPSTELIKKFNIIEQFKSLNIKSVINLQVPGEHGHCGDPLELKSGFSYLPETFMENDIYFFNFGMADFGVSSLVRVLDAVKVTSFAVQEGKVAVHCHAGLGRTGVLIACYLVYATRVSPSEAVHFVRIKRPCSIQTRTQINLVFDFAQFVDSHRTIFTNASVHAHSVTLRQHLHRQRHLLHGYEARQLKHVPKMVDFACKGLVRTACDREACVTVQVEIQREANDRAMVLHIRETIASFLTSPEFLQANQQPEDPDNDSGGQRPLSVGQCGTNAPAIVLDGPTNPVKHSISCEGKGNFVGGRSPAKTDQAAGIILPRQGKSLLTNASLVSTAGRKGKVHGSHSVKESVRKTDVHESLLETVARAMSEGPPVQSDLLTRVGLWQVELNENEGAWARLATEEDPRILSVLMWSWLEYLKVEHVTWWKELLLASVPLGSAAVESAQEPVLRSQDVATFLSKSTAKQGLWDLEKCQEETISCILDCISKLIGLPSELEDSIIHRLIRALTQSGEEDVAHFDALLHKLKMIIREKRSHYLFTRGLVKTATLVKIASHGKSK